LRKVVMGQNEKKVMSLKKGRPKQRNLDLTIILISLINMPHGYTNKSTVSINLDTDTSPE
jgi:hypothetical protein